MKFISYLLAGAMMFFLLPVNNVDATTSTYLYEWMSQSGTVSADGLAHGYTGLQAGDTINLSLTLINRSNTTIKKLSDKSYGSHGPDQAVAPGVWGIGSQTPYQDGTPHFLDFSSFILNNNRFVYYTGADVADGQPITMSWNVKLKDNLANGTYNLYVRPVSEYLAWTRQIKNGKVLPTTSSDIFWRFVVGESSGSDTAVYGPLGADAVFNYPSSWVPEHTPQSYGNAAGYVGLDDTSYYGGEKNDVYIFLYSIGTSIDSAIQNFHNTHNDYWKGQSRTISSLLTNQYGRSWKKVVYEGTNGGNLVSWFVQNQHGFVVLVRSDADKYGWVGETITNTIR